MLRTLLRRLAGRDELGNSSPLVQEVVNNGCSFGSCGEPWQGQEWHGWRLCAEHYGRIAARALDAQRSASDVAQTMDRAAVRV